MDIYKICKRMHIYIYVFINIYIYLHIHICTHMRVHRCASFSCLLLVIDLSLYQEMPMKSASKSFIYFLSYVCQEVMMMMMMIKIKTCFLSVDIAKIFLI